MRFLTTLDRYLFGQLFLTIFFGVALFSVIWLAPDVLFKLIQYVFAGDISVAQAGEMFILHLPTVFQQSIPIAALLGSIFVFTRLSQQFEIIAMWGSGISPMRIGRAILWVALVFGLMHVAAQELLVPVVKPRLEAMYTRLDLKEEKDRNFVFVEKNRHDLLEKFFLIGQTQGQRLENFIILYFEPVVSQTAGETADVRISRIVTARTGKWQPQSKQWQLQDGLEYVLNDEGVYREIRPFKEQRVIINRYAANLLAYSQRNPLSLNWASLNDYIHLLEMGEQKQDVPYFRVLLYQKLAAPISSMVFVFLGAILGMERVRSNRTYGLTYGVLIVFLYSIMSPFATNLGSVNEGLAFLVAWIPLTLAILATLALSKYRPQDS